MSNRHKQQVAAPYKPGAGAVITPPAKLVRFTPAMAAQILETRNTLNRSVRQSRVDRYAADMRAGRWKVNGETVKFTKSGALLDGQHRLWAVVEADTTVEMMVVEGLDEDVMPTIDTGAARSYGDVSRIRGRKNVNVLAATARLVYWYENERGTNMRASTPTHAQLDEVLNEYPDLEDRVAEAEGYRQARRILTPGTLSFVYFMASRIDEDKAAEWCSLLNSGANMDEVHPVRLLRERMIANRTAPNKLKPEVVLALAVKSWNMFLSGKHRTVLVWRQNDPFPEF